MSSLTVTVEGAAGRTTLRVDGERPLADELPRLALLTGYAVPGAGWFAAREDGTPLRSGTGLAAQEVADGSIIRVAALVPATAPAGTAAPEASNDPPLLLPVRPPTRRRMWDMALAFLGTVELRGAAGQGPISRARSAWRWADRRRRLEWVVATAELPRTVLIGVCSLAGSATSARLARDLTTVFAEHRREPVSLVDAARSGTHQARHAIAEQLTGWPGIVVVDCCTPDSRLTDHCDQLVMTSGHPSGTAVPRHPGLVVAEPISEATAAGSDARIAEATLELAAGLAARWGRSHVGPADG